MTWLGVLLLALGWAAGAGAREMGWQVRVWMMSEGLAGNNINDVVQSDDGFIWFIAGSTLERFDGVSFTAYPLEAVSSFKERGPGEKVRAMARLRGGGVVLATFHGDLLRVDRHGTTVLAKALPLGTGRIESFFEDDDGAILASTNGGTVWSAHRGQVAPFEAGLPSGSHARFLRDVEGRVWFAKGATIGVRRGGTFAAIAHFPPNSAPHLAAAREGGVWVAAGARLLRCRDGETLQEVAALPANIPAQPNTLFEDHTGAVWLGTYDSGLFRFNGSTFETVPVSHRQVVCLAEDREANLWVGTSGGGLNEVQPRAITVEGRDVGAPYAAVLALAEDAAGNLWGFTQAGRLVARRDHAWQPVEGVDPGGEVCSLAAEPGGALWFGTKNGLLHRWTEGRLQTWGAADGIAAAGPRQLLVARNGDVWLGSQSPRLLQRIRAGKLQTFAAAGAGSIRALIEDAAGDIWVAANGTRLARITPAGRVIDESARIASAGRNVRQLAAGSDGALWLGFDQAGVGRLKDGKFGRVTSNEGLLFDNIELMVDDGRGSLWVIARQTVSKVSEAELGAVIEHRASRVRPIRYGEEQGLRPTFGETIAPLLRRDGTLWIPLATSLAVIDPAQLVAPSGPPPVWINEMRVDDRLVAAHPGLLPMPGVASAEHSRLELSPGHRRIEIDYTAPSFDLPANVRFRYRLENFDDHWVDAGTRRTVSYSRLPAGDYRLHVRAASAAGVWNDAGATLRFVVAPFFWETWWFRGAAILAFATAIAGGTRYVSHRRLRQRLRAAEQEAAVHRERARIARDIHDDLGSRLTKIVLLSGLAARERTTAKDGTAEVQEISDTARQLLASLDETVWSVNPRNDDLPHLVSYLGQFAVSFLRTAEIACDVELPDDPPPLPLAAEVRHHVFLAAKEALTNVVRHAAATHVTLRVEMTADAVQISISDNGCGIAGPTDQPEADGLNNMRQRLDQIGGQFSVTPRPGGGTTVTFTIPTARELPDKN